MPVHYEITVFALLACGYFLCIGETAQSPKPIPEPFDALVYPGDYGYNLNRQNVHYHQHSHPRDEDYDDRSSHKPANNRKDDAIMKIWSMPEQNKPEIPVSFIKEINNKGYTVNDLLLHYVEDYDDEVDLTSRYGERDSTTFAKEAKCMPELKSVDIIENKDPSVLYIPSCIRIERCGGCCMHQMLSCQPNETETINIKVVKVMYTGGKTLKYASKEIVPVSVHKSCKCDCRIRPEDCTPMQIYEKNECKCACKNTDEEKKCAKENSTKLWNPSACACQCREELTCTTGSVFDWRECRCVVKQIRRRNVEVSRRSGYKSRALSVLPFSEDYL